MKLTFLASIAVLVATVAASPGQAEDLARPAGDVVLTISGAIENTNDNDVAVFDIAMLEQLPGRITQTQTPWYDGAHKFSGPLGWALLSAVGAHGTMLHVTAINDYVTDIPVSDLKDYEVILATRLDGEPMSVRDKGPLFVIYPFDEKPALNNEVYYGRSAWQVKSIEVY